MPHGVPGSHLQHVPTKEPLELREIYEDTGYGYGTLEYDDPNSVGYVDEGLRSLFPETNTIPAPIIFLSAFFLWRFLK